MMATARGEPPRHVLTAAWVKATIGAVGSSAMLGADLASGDTASYAFAPGLRCQKRVIPVYEPSLRLARKRFALRSNEDKCLGHISHTTGPQPIVLSKPSIIMEDQFSRVFLEVRWYEVPFRDEMISDVFVAAHDLVFDRFVEATPVPKRASRPVEMYLEWCQKLKKNNEFWNSLCAAYKNERCTRDFRVVTESNRAYCGEQLGWKLV